MKKTTIVNNDFLYYFRSKKSNNAAYAQIQRDYHGKYDDTYDYEDTLDFRTKHINFNRI